MGFFDDLNEGIRRGREEESERSAWRRSNSSYRTSVEAAQDMQRKFESYSDGRLLNAAKSASASNEEKAVIHSILLRRGYTKIGNDYRRR